MTEKKKNIIGGRDDVAVCLVVHMTENRNQNEDPSGKRFVSKGGCEDNCCTVQPLRMLQQCVCFSHNKKQKQNQHLSGNRMDEGSERTSNADNVGWVTEAAIATDEETF